MTFVEVPRAKMVHEAEHRSTAPAMGAFGMYNRKCSYIEKVIVIQLRYYTYHAEYKEKGKSLYIIEASILPTNLYLRLFLSYCKYHRSNSVSLTKTHVYSGVHLKNDCFLSAIQISKFNLLGYFALRVFLNDRDDDTVKE